MRLVYIIHFLISATVKENGTVYKPGATVTVKEEGVKKSAGSDAVKEDEGVKKSANKNVDVKKSKTENGKCPTQ